MLLSMLIDFLSGVDIISKFPLTVTPIIMVISQNIPIEIVDRLPVQRF